jgi:hypothetical protein
MAWAFILKFRWLVAVIEAMRRAQDHIKNGERILGDKEFIQFVLDLVKRIEKGAKSDGRLQFH